MISENNELVGALKKGDSRQFEKCYNEYYSRLFTFAFGYTRNYEASEEMVQNGFVILWNKKETLAPDSNISSYLFTVVKNQCLNYIRDEAKRLSHEIKGDFPFSSIQDLRSYTLASFIPEKLINEDLEKIILNEIDQLPEQCRRVFLMSRFEQLSHKEISTHLNISVKTVENHINKALQVLRKRLGIYLYFFLIIYTKYLNN